MDVVQALEERIDRLIAGYRDLKDRVAELENENRQLKESAGGASQELEERVAELEQERGALRERLEKLLASLASLPE